MNILRTGLSTVAILIAATTTKAASLQPKGEENSDTPKGKAIITIFSDVHAGFGTVNDDRAFYLDRAYIGYQYNVNKELQIKAIADFGRTDELTDYQRIGFIKNAMVTWKKNGRWTLNAGLIPTTQFKIQEDFWARRYVMKSFQDEYGFGSSADAGISVAYRCTPWLEADAIVVNGEGYKNIQVGDGWQYGVGLTMKPLEGLLIRAYASLNEGNHIENGKNNLNVATFVGYRNHKGSIAAEYNYEKNSEFTDKHDRQGISVYADFNVAQKAALFARCDYLRSRRHWDAAQEATALMIGAEVRLGKFIKLAPNIRLRMPEEKGSDCEAYTYLNAAFVY